MAFAPFGSTSPAGAPGVVVPYRMHVSQKYLDLTKQKLDLTRLPREPHTTRQQDPSTTKADLERLVDHWTEDYSWRAQEKYYNEVLPQFRVPIHSTRVHFAHRRSTSTNAIPLIFVHGWPDSFIAVSNMIDALCEPVRTPPRGDDNVPAFHVVAPSIPGFGFSDQVAEDGNNLFTTARIFDTLMKTLGYGRYIVHGSGWGFKIGRVLALNHSESCIGIHTACPETPTARFVETIIAELSTCKLTAGMHISHTAQMSPPFSPGTQTAQTGNSQTISYALCDSPAGLLAYVIAAIKPPPQLSSPQAGRPAEVSNPWSPTTLISWTMLHWLPGPEVALRWLANSMQTPDLWTSFSNVPLAISQYEDAGRMSNDLVWAEQFHPIAMVRNRAGTVRFPAWERPAEMVHDIRDLARLVAPSIFASYVSFPAGTGYDQTY